MKEEAKYSKVNNNQATEYNTNQSIQNTQMNKSSLKSTTAGIELTVNGNQQNKDNEDDTKYSTADNETSNKNNEEYKNNQDNVRTYYCICCKFGKKKVIMNVKDSNKEENLELETCCCDCWGIKKVKRKNIKSYDGYNDMTEKQKNKSVVRLDEDIWALGYVVARNRKKLPCSFILLLCSIYMVQISTLLAIIWGYGVPDTIKQMDLDGNCKIDIPDIMNDTFGNATYWYTGLQCSKINKWDRVARRQTWAANYALRWSGPRMRDARNKGMTAVWDVMADLDVFIFPFTEIVSFILLAFYIISSLTNPIIFFIIAHEYNKVNFRVYTLFEAF